MHERGNIYLRLDPCNGLGEGWVFALDKDDKSALMKNLTEPVQPSKVDEAAVKAAADSKKSAALLTRQNRFTVLQRLFDAEAISVCEPFNSTSEAPTAPVESQVTNVSQQLSSHCLAYLGEADSTQPLFTEAEIMLVSEMIPNIAAPFQDTSVSVHPAAYAGADSSAEITLPDLRNPQSLALSGSKHKAEDANAPGARSARIRQVIYILIFPFLFPFFFKKKTCIQFILKFVLPSIMFIL